MSRTIVLEKPLGRLMSQCQESIKVALSKGLFRAATTAVNIDAVRHFDIARLVLNCEQINTQDKSDRRVYVSEQRLMSVFRMSEKHLQKKEWKVPIRFILATNWDEENSESVAERYALGSVISDLAMENIYKDHIAIEQLGKIYGVNEEWYKKFIGLLRPKEKSEKVVPLINITHPSPSIFLELGVSCARCEPIYLLCNRKHKSTSEEMPLPNFIANATGRIITDFTHEELKEYIIKIIGGIWKRDVYLPSKLPKDRSKYSFSSMPQVRTAFALCGEHTALDEKGLRTLQEKLTETGKTLIPPVICKIVKNARISDWHDVVTYAKHICNSDIVLLEFGNNKAYLGECSFFAGFSVGLRKRRQVILSAPIDHKDFINFWWGPRIYWWNIELLAQDLIGKIG